MPQENADTESFFQSLEERVVRAPDGRITFEGGTAEERSAFMRQWLALTGQDPDDYDR